MLTLQRNTLRASLARAWYAIKPLSDSSVREQVDSTISQMHGQIHGAGCKDPECDFCKTVKPAALSAVSALRAQIEESIRQNHSMARLQLVAIADKALVRFALAYLVVRTLM